MQNSWIHGQTSPEIALQTHLTLGRQRWWVPLKHWHLSNKLHITSLKTTSLTCSHLSKPSVLWLEPYSLAAFEQSPDHPPLELAVFPALQSQFSLLVALLPGHQSAPWMTQYIINYHTPPPPSQLHTHHWNCKIRAYSSCENRDITVCLQGDSRALFWGHPLNISTLI